MALPLVSAATGEQLEFGILGPLEVLNGDPVDLGGHKQRAVLAILLIEAGRTVSTDAVIDRLWGDDAPPTAQGTLQAYISNLRKALEPHRSTREGPSILVSRPGGYALQVAEGELDAERFEHLAGEGAALLAKENFAAARQSLVAALALWRGSALADFAFDEFATEEIARLEELKMSALEDRIESDMALGNHGALVAELRPLVERYPVRERLRGQLMLALYREARQAEALEIYQEARVRLADELGIDPGPELRRLHETILRQDAQLDWRPPSHSVPTMPMSGPLLGRDADMDVLLRAAESARSGWGRLVIIAGDAGIGKTRLSDDFTSGLDGFDVVWGRCHEGGGAPPLWPWLNVLKSITADRSPEELLQLAGSEAADLIHLVPDLAAADPELRASDALDAESSRFRLYVAVTQFLARLARARPLALVLDDLHWADVATLQLVHFLASEVSQTHILVIATYRDIEISSKHPLSETLAAVARLAVVERLLLRGLEVDDVAAYVSSVIGYEPPQSTVQVLHERTGGNPFFVAQLVRLLDTRGELREGSDAVVTTVPANVRDVILRRVSALPEVTARVLKSAAVVGRDFEVEVMTRVEGIDRDSVLDAVESAVASRIVLPAPDAIDVYRFSHALVREALYEDMTSIARARIHFRAAGALEDLYPDDARVPEIAHHLFNAAGVAPIDTTIHYATRAAEHALAHLAYEQAEEHLRHGLKLLERGPIGTERSRQELAIQVRLSGLMMVTRGYAAPEVATRLARARDLAREVADNAQLLPILRKLGVFHEVRGDMDVALKAAEELLNAANDLDDANWQWAGHHARGIVALQMGELELARQHLERALALADSVDPSVIAEIAPEQDATVSCLGFLAWTLVLSGEVARAKELIGQQLARARRLEHPFGVAFALLFGSFVGATDGDVRLVRERTEELIPLAKERGFRLYETAGGIYLGWAIAQKDDAQIGTNQLIKALGEFEATGAKMLASLHYSLLAEAHRRAGQPDDALAAIDVGLHRTESSGERFLEAELHRLRGEVLLDLAAPDPVEARASLDKALAVSRAQGARLLERRAQASVKQLQLVGDDKEISPRRSGRSS